MRRKFSVILIAGLILLPFNAWAVLIDNHDGTITQIRKDGSRLMWLKNTGIPGYILNWHQAIIWAENLVFAGYDDWRLPSALNSDGTGPCSQYNCTGSEMGYMYYMELGNNAYESYTYDGPFINNSHAGYWTNTEYNLDLEKAFIFNFHVKNQDPDNKVVSNGAWAVRDMDPPPDNDED